jgi:hypothetical protein
LWERILNGEILDPFELAAAELDDIAAALNAAGVVEAFGKLERPLANYEAAKTMADERSSAFALAEAARAALAAAKGEKP